MTIRFFGAAIGIILVLGGILLASERRSLLSEGNTAPNFTAKLSTGEFVSLIDYRGKKNVVLFFYPKDFTPGCTKQVCSFRDHYDHLLRYDAVVLGVSADGAESHQRFIAQNNLPFPLISDADKSISSMYGAAGWFGGFIPGMKRATFVIDKQGIIRSVLHYEVLIGKHVEGVIDALKKLGESRQIEPF